MEHAAIRELVSRNPGRASVEEYTLVHEAVTRRAPCNFLVFGVGRDAALGATVFLENAPAWTARIRREVGGITVHRVRYPTVRALWPLVRYAPRLLWMRDLPPAVVSARWDVILVDAPRGTRWYRPGRMMSIYTAARLAHNSSDCDVFVHDTDRRVERECCEAFFRAHELVAEVRSMRHYRVR